MHISPRANRVAAAFLMPGMLMASSAQGQPMGGSEHVTIRASTDYSALGAGKTGLLAIDIIVADGWHTYWPGISDTGYGVSFQIDAPEGIELKAPIWPSPMRYLQPGNILDHTYEGTETVLFPFAIKEGTPESVVVFNIEADFLVCKDICLPGEASTTTSIRVHGEDGADLESSSHDAIRKVFAERPIEFRPTDPAVRLQWIKGAAAVMFRGATRIEFYPDTECTALAEPMKDGAEDGNRLEIRFQSTDSTSSKAVLSGRLKVTTGSGTKHYDINETSP